jgi:hypothetical protein
MILPSPTRHALWLSLLCLGSVSLLPHAAIAAVPSEESARAKSLAEEGRGAFERGDYRAAGARFLAAYRIDAVDTVLFAAAVSFERAGDPITAERLYFEFSQLAGVNPDQLADALAFLARQRQAREEETDRAAMAEKEKSKAQQEQWLLEHAKAAPSAARGPSGWAWASTGVGLALVGTGLGLRFRASGLRQDVLDAQSRAVDGVVPRLALTQREAADRDDSSKRANLWGAVTLGIGAAALLGGVVGLVVTRERPATSAHTSVSAAPVPGGAAVTYSRGF